MCFDAVPRFTDFYSSFRSQSNVPRMRQNWSAKGQRNILTIQERKYKKKEHERLLMPKSGFKRACHFGI